MVTAELDADTQVLDGQARYTQSTCWCPSCTGMSASFGRGKMDAPNHYVVGFYETIGFDVVWRLLHQLSLHCMYGYGIICLASMRHSLLVLAFAPVPLSGLFLNRLPVRPPHVMNTISCLTL